MSEIIFEKECYTHLINYIDKTIDKKYSSGIRESVRILEKILLEINKEILCEMHVNLKIIKYERYINYFNKLKSQFPSIEDIPLHMYI